MFQKEHYEADKVTITLNPHQPSKDLEMLLEVKKQLQYPQKLAHLL